MLNKYGEYAKTAKYVQGVTSHKQNGKAEIQT